MMSFSEKIKKLALSYDIDDLLEENDIEEEHVIKILVEEGLIDLDDYFDLPPELYGEDQDD